VKEFLFVMQLLLPNGEGPPAHREKVPTLVDCLSRVAAMQSANANQNGQFVFVTTCVQISSKADPA
jgi:hypothetical protein